MSIYIASKTAHAGKWRALRASGIPIISTWIDDAGPGETSDWADLWSRCVTEAASAQVVIVYREPGEIIKGALVEAGAALACGHKVFVVGCSDLSFRLHPLVTEYATMPDALMAAMTPAPRTASIASGQTAAGDAVRATGDAGSSAPTSSTAAGES